MNLLIFGAGGAIGRRVTAEATSRGHQVSAVYRNPPADRGRAVVALPGDVRNPTALLSRHPPYDAVVSAVGAGRGADADYDVYYDAAVSLIDALRRMPPPIPRLVVVGGAGSLQLESGGLLVDEPGFPPHVREEALAQKRALDYYRTIDAIPWTYISPAPLLEPGTHTGGFRVGGDQLLTDNDGQSRISIDDYADALVDEVERVQTVGRRISVAY